MSDIDLKCGCGEPDCQGHATFRRGYVEITDEDGKTEERWDHFHIDAQQGNDWAQLICSPKDARKLMWFLIWNYFPLLSMFIRFLGWLRSQLSFAGWRLVRCFKSISNRLAPVGRPFCRLWRSFSKELSRAFRRLLLWRSNR